MRATIAVLLLVVPMVAGCAAPPSVRATARAGDFIVADVRESLDNGTVVRDVAGLRLYLGTDLPGTLPDGFDPNATGTASPGLVRALEGLSAGKERSLRVEAEEAYGVRQEARTFAVPRSIWTERTVERSFEDVPHARAVPVGETVRLPFLGIEMNGTLILRGDATFRARLEPDESVQGAVLLDPAYWNDNYRLWASRLSGWNDTHVLVTHEAEAGTQATVGGLPYRVVSVSQEIVVDSNHELSGQAITYRARLVSIFFVSGTANGLAPEIRAETTTGTLVHLSDYRGRVVLVEFFATWCLTCSLQATNLAEAKRRLGDRAEFLSVSIDPRERAQDVHAFVSAATRQAQEQYGPGRPIDWTFAIDRTGASAREYAVFVLSKEVVVDASGRIRATATGLHPPDRIVADVETALAQS